MAQRIAKGTTLQGIPARSWNQFCDLVARTPKDPPLKSVNPGTPGQAIDILVQNKSGADLTANFPILRLTDPIFTIADNADAYLNGVSFEGDTPDAGTGSDFAVMQGKCPSDGICAAVIQGATWCKVNVTDSGHTHATSIASDNAKLASGGAGARILWKESGTGEKWAIVLIGGGSSSEPVKVLITADVAAASYSSGTLTPTTFTARLWMASGSNWTQSSGDTKDCTNPYLTAIDVTSGKGRMAWVTSAGELISVDCTEFTL